MSLQARSPWKSLFMLLVFLSLSWVVLGVVHLVGGA